jgi:hypothetical protein
MMTTEECVYWLAVVSATADEWSRAASSRASWLTWLLVSRDLEQLREERNRAVDFARIHVRNEPGKRAWLTLWALCRAAIRAIENERSK